LTEEENDIEVYWFDNFTLNVQFNDTATDKGINEATVTWTVVENTEITDSLLRNSSKGEGWYSVEINSTRLNHASTFTIHIEASQQNYASQSLYIYVTVKELYTLINGSTTDVLIFDVFCLEEQIMYYNYTYRIGPEFLNTFVEVENATFATYDWEYQQNPSQNGTGILEYNAITKLYKLDFQTEIRPLGTYTLNIRLAEINFIPRMGIAIIDIINRSTSASEDLNDLVLNHGWEDQLINFTYIDTATSQDITEATASYTWISYTNSSRENVMDNGNGVLNENGNYTLDFDTSSRDIGFYVLLVTLDKINYTSQQIEIRLTIITSLALTEVLLEEDTVSIFWKENITATIEYNNVSGTYIPVPFATVTYQVNGYEHINGILSEGTPGVYTINLNSTVFPNSGEYTITIFASREYFSPNSTIFLIEINDLYTQINGSASIIEEIDIYKSEHELFYFEYSVRRGDIDSLIFDILGNISDATYEWEYRDNSSMSGIGILQFNPVTGLYKIDFETETLPIGTYVLTVLLNEPNYIARVAIITLNVNPLLVHYEFLDDVEIDTEDNLLMHSIKQGDVFQITITLTEDLNGSSMSDVTVLWQGDDGETGDFIHIGNGVYEYNLTGDVDAFIQQQTINGKILISATDHQSFNITAQIIVEMPEIFEGMPTFYFVLILGFVAVIVVSLGGYKYVQQARIPIFIKKCDKIVKDLRKNRKIDAESLVTEIKEEILIQMYGEDWEFFGLDFKDSIGYTEKKREQDLSRDTNELEKEIEEEHKKEQDLSSDTDVVEKEPAVEISQKDEDKKEQDLSPNPDELEKQKEPTVENYQKDEDKKEQDLSSDTDVVEKEPAVETSQEEEDKKEQDLSPDSDELEKQKEPTVENFQKDEDKKEQDLSPDTNELEKQKEPAVETSQEEEDKKEQDLSPDSDELEKQKEPTGENGHEEVD
jgi:hypothetical protein